VLQGVTPLLHWAFRERKWNGRSVLVVVSGWLSTVDFAPPGGFRSVLFHSIRRTWPAFNGLRPLCQRASGRASAV